MNRKSFLKKLGIGLGVAIVAPKVFGGEAELVLIPNRILIDDNGHCYEEALTKLTNPDGYAINMYYWEKPTKLTPNEVLSIWKHTGLLPTGKSQIFFSKYKNIRWGNRDGFLIDNDKKIRWFRVPA
jgi:hypothetical protein